MTTMDFIGTADFVLLALGAVFVAITLIIGELNGGKR